MGASNEILAAIKLAKLADPGNRIMNLLIANRGYCDALQYIEDLVANKFNDEIQEKFNMYAKGNAKFRNGDCSDSIDYFASQIALFSWHFDRMKIESPAQDEALLDRHSIGVILQTDPNYPEQFNTLNYQKPIVLFCRGDSKLMEAKNIVAIVGTRGASAYGKKITYELAESLSEQGCIIASGGAIGIDSFAHLKSLGRSISFMAGGLHTFYPSQNINLLEENIKMGGLAVSEIPAGVHSNQFWFLQRNRLIAAISKITVIVESGWRSGALNTAKHAADLNKIVAAFPGPVDKPSNSGTNKLIQDSKAILITGSQDLLGLLDLEKYEISEGDVHHERLGQEQSEIMNVMTAHLYKTADQISQATNLSIRQILPELFSLESSGLIEKKNNGYRLIAKTLPKQKVVNPGLNELVADLSVAAV